MRGKLDKIQESSPSEEAKEETREYIADAKKAPEPKPKKRHLRVVRHLLCSPSDAIPLLLTSQHDLLLLDWRCIANSENGVDDYVT